MLSLISLVILSNVLTGCCVAILVTRKPKSNHVECKISFDAQKCAESVSEICNNEFFTELQSKARELRANRS